jgi:YVTN family beta-propeller protein
MSISTDPRIGSELFGYRLEALLGRGGMGVVYKAYDSRLKRNVALKLIAPELSEDEGFRERFLAESELAASLDHPNVVPIYDAFDAEGRLAIAMRYVEGTDLKQLLQTDRVLDPGRAVAICGQVAAALDAAHARGLVHRDVKPSNVLLDENEHVYLADFGLSRRLADPGVPGGGSFSVGTPAYAAPEQIEGGEVDGRTDVYSLGCVLHECLAGEVPFVRDSELAVLWAHVQEEPPVLPGLEEVIPTALAKDPDERYATCGELVEVARQALGLRDVVMVRDRRPLLLATVGFLLAGGTAAAAVLLSQGGGGFPRPSTTPTLAPKADSLQRIDPKTNRLVATVGLDSHPTSVAVDQRSVWITHLENGTISEVDPRTNVVVKESGAGPSPAAVVAGFGSVWTASGSEGTVTQIDARTVAPLHVVALLDLDPSLLAVGDGAVWAASSFPAVVARINPLDGSVTAKIRAPTLPLTGLAVGKHAVWVAGGDPTAANYSVSRIDPARNRVVATIPLRLGAVGVAVGAGAVWVANSLGATLSRIEPAANRVTRKIRVGRDPIAVAFGEGSVWVANRKDGTVSRIDPRRDVVVQTIRVGPNPDGIAVGLGGVWVMVHVR